VNKIRIVRRPKVVKSAGPVVTPTCFVPITTK